jgi:hypothetical protein
VARAVMDGEITSFITFDEADLLIRGLRTWAKLKHTHLNTLDNIRELTNLKAGIKRTQKRQAERLQPKEFSRGSFKERETREPTLAYTRLHKPRKNAVVTPTK